MLAKLREWAYDRTGVGPETFEKLNRGVARGVGWGSTLGSAAVALIVVLGLSGIFLAMYYSPHPDAAYETVRYIDHNLPMGRLVHGLHSYAADGLVILLFFHLLRSYVLGSYKPPRELVWVVGVLILNVVILFGFTGLLLPWDQKGFFGTRVRTGFPEGVPVIGPILQQLLRGGDDVGALTITRFYALHALLLPAILIPLVQWHASLAWRKGATPPGARVGEEEQPTTRFLDHHLLRHMIAAFAIFLVIYLLAVLRPVQIEFKANPSDSTYRPRAEWYFLFLFQLLNDFGKIPGLGTQVWIAAVVLPGLAVTFLILAPWIDRSPERDLKKRPVMMAALAAGLLGMAFMSLRAVTQLHPNATPSTSLYGHYTDGDQQELDPAQVNKGRAAFARCGSCHVAYDDYHGSLAPDLSGYGRKTFLDTVKGHADSANLNFHDRFVSYVRGGLRPPTTKMPKYPLQELSNEQLEAIGAYVSQDPEKAVIQHANPRR